MKYHLIRFLKTFGQVLFLAAIAVPIWMYFEPPPVSYSQRKVLNEKVAPGETLRIQISADIQKQCPAVVYRTIVDSTGLPFDLLPVPRPNETDYVVEVPVPLGVSPGPAYYKARLLWSCNIIQKWFPREVIQRNITFIIEPSDGQLPVPERQGVYEKPVEKSELARAQR